MEMMRLKVRKLKEIFMLLLEGSWGKLHNPLQGMEGFVSFEWIITIPFEYKILNYLHFSYKF